MILGRKEGLRATLASPLLAAVRRVTGRRSARLTREFILDSLLAQFVNPGLESGMVLLKVRLELRSSTLVSFLEVVHPHPLLELCKGGVQDDE